MVFLDLIIILIKKFRRIIGLAHSGNISVVIVSITFLSFFFFFFSLAFIGFIYCF
jgi:hypothetical protein